MPNEGISTQVPVALPCDDVFVAKLDPTGSKLIYSTYLGGDSRDYPSGLGLDSSGNAYVTGSTSSTNFPVTPNAFQGKNGGGTCPNPLTVIPAPTTCADTFVTKLDLNGKLVYSTYLGGSRKREQRRRCGGFVGKCLRVRGDPSRGLSSGSQFEYAKPWPRACLRGGIEPARIRIGLRNSTG